MLKASRLKAIRFLIDLNERLVFERRLKNRYKTLFGRNNIKIVLDVGANKGQTIDFFKKINRECIFFSFEPNQDLHKLLVLKYKGDGNVKLYNAGVSNVTGKKNFHQNILDYTSTFEELNPESVYLRSKAQILGVKPEEIVVATYQVDTVTLSDFINDQVEQPIDVLKIDVEGHEYQCLQGLFNKKLKVPIRFIQLENHTDDMYQNKTSFDKIEHLLVDNGFKVESVVKHGFGNIEEYIFINSNLV